MRNKPSRRTAWIRLCSRSRTWVVADRRVSTTAILSPEQLLLQCIKVLGSGDKFTVGLSGRFFARWIDCSFRVESDADVFDSAQDNLGGSTFPDDPDRIVWFSGPATNPMLTGLIVTVTHQIRADGVYTKSLRLRPVGAN